MQMPVPPETTGKPPVIIGLMRVFFPLFVCGAVLFAQTPAPVRPAAKSGVAHAPSAGAPAVPAGRNAKAPDILRVICEMIAGLDGLGQWVLLAARAYRSADVFAGVILLGAIGVVANGLISLIEGRLLRWRTP